jgi:putative transposase
LSPQGLTLQNMPARNSIKTYVENGYYHLYNRGVEKRVIFQDEQDQGVFLGYLKEYLSPKDEKSLRKAIGDPDIPSKQKDGLIKSLRMNNFFDEMKLLAYCLMPNHFHLLVKQRASFLIDRFMQSLTTRYTMYFNRKYKRVGGLFQGVYKAVLVDSNEQLLHLSRYIHKQALDLNQRQPSSYEDYLGKRKTDWLYPNEILFQFSNSKLNGGMDYLTFVNGNRDFVLDGRLLLDDNEI